MDRIKDVLHSLMKQQRIPLCERSKFFEKMQNDFGSDEALWQAEVDRQQALVDALGDRARRTRDTKTPKLFVQLALEHMKKSVSVDTALSILDDLSKKKLKSSLDFSMQLYNHIILRHDDFQGQRASFSAFISWRDHGRYCTNRSLLKQFISEIGTQEQKARLQTILAKDTIKSGKRKRRQGNDLNCLAEAASQLQESTSAGVEGGTVADLWTEHVGELPPGTEGTLECVEMSVQESGEFQSDCSDCAGEKREVTSAALGRARRKQPRFTEDSRQHKMTVAGSGHQDPPLAISNRARIQRRSCLPLLAKRVPSNPSRKRSQKAPILEGVFCCACDGPASHACRCGLTNFCSRCSRVKNFCNLCRNDFPGGSSHQRLCGSCFYPLPTKDPYECRDCGGIYCDDCAVTGGDPSLKREKCVNCAEKSEFFSARRQAIRALKAACELVLQKSQATADDQSTLWKFCSLMVSLNSVGMLELFQEHCEFLRAVLEWQSTHGIEVSLTSSQIARLQLPGTMHIDLLKMVSIASASETAKAALQLGTECEELAELRGEESVRVCILLGDCTAHPMIDMGAEMILRMMKGEKENNLVFTLVLLQTPKGNLAKDLAASFKEKGKLIQLRGRESDRAILKKLRSEGFHITLDLISMAAGRRQALMQAPISHLSVHYLNFPGPSFDRKANTVVVMDELMARIIVGQESAEHVAKLSCCWLNVQHPTLMDSVDRTILPNEKGTFHVMVVGGVERIDQEGRRELLTIALETKHFDVSFGLYRFPSVAYDLFRYEAQIFAREKGIDEQEFLERFRPYDFKCKSNGNHLNRLRESHMGLILHGVYPPHTNACDLMVAAVPFAATGMTGEAAISCAAAATESMMRYGGLGGLVSTSQMPLCSIVKQMIRDHVQNGGRMRKAIQATMDRNALDGSGFWSQDRIPMSLIRILVQMAESMRHGRRLELMASPYFPPNPDCVVVGDNNKLVWAEPGESALLEWRVANPESSIFPRDGEDTLDDITDLQHSVEQLSCQDAPAPLALSNKAPSSLARFAQ